MKSVSLRPHMTAARCWLPRCARILKLGTFGSNRLRGDRPMRMLRSSGDALRTAAMSARIA